MKNIITISLIFVLVCCTYCCEETEVTASEVIKLQIENGLISIPADGTSTVKILGLISVQADEDKRNIEFETTNGVFIKNNEKLLMKEAKDTLLFEGKNYLAAEVILKASNDVDADVKVTAEIAFYPSTKILSFTESEPTSLVISADGFGIDNDITSEILISSKVKSATGFPSSGNSLKYQVFDKSTGFEFNSNMFRDEKLSVDSSGSSSVIFTAGNLELNGEKYTGELLIISQLENNSAISDSLNLTITQQLD